MARSAPEHVARVWIGGEQDLAQTRRGEVQNTLDPSRVRGLCGQRSQDASAEAVQPLAMSSRGRNG